MSMTNTHDQDDDDQGQPATVTLSRKDIRALEKAANEGKQALAQLAQMQRVEAFRAAGIDPSDARQSYFVKGYDGEATPEAIKAAALAAGFIAEQPAPGSIAPPQVFGGSQTGLPSGISQQELARLALSNQATAGAVAPQQDLSGLYNQELTAAVNSGVKENVLAVMQKFGVHQPGMD
jgi:hypothetical protein